MADIRQANIDDIDELVALGFRMKQESPRYRDKGYSGMKVRELLQALLASPDGIVLVATDGGIIGMVWAMVTTEFFSLDRKAVEFVVYVAPEHRGGTTGVRLVRAFEDAAAIRGAQYIVLGISTGINADRTERLYERMGYEVAGTSLLKRCA